MAHSDLHRSDHLVLPLELGPHRAEGEVRARRRLNVVHDVDVDVVEHDVVAVGRAARALVHNRAEDDPGLGRRDLDVRLRRKSPRSCVRIAEVSQIAERVHRWAVALTCFDSDGCRGWDCWDPTNIEQWKRLSSAVVLV